MGFTRNKENFVCGHCGAAVAGDGYTNHCPQCLWSKHVDVDPGDRMATCDGLMEPVSLEGSTPDYVITQRCVRCGHVRRNKLQTGDSPDAVIALAKKQAR
ncbi:MAG: RNHCP domain-containing protein [Candidatus Paceibacterota bacterium]